ncbi:hypothetical protein A3Q56_04779 [Intoshia linei]|uniref:Uncharacterized protein n=1 Tax=Intoshia linei TaxID=1819745 RepID=A0A177AZQ0_9BILA|nr:hypothetical protein A3Q56_04779 [Intoshia linei]
MSNITLVSEVFFGQPQPLLLPTGNLSMDVDTWLEAFDNFIKIHWDDVKQEFLEAQRFFLIVLATYLVFPKPELGKKRLVVKSEMQLYMEMAYLSEIENVLMINLEEKTKKDGLVFFMLDQSAFDKNQSGRMVLSLLGNLKNIIESIKNGTIDYENVNLGAYRGGVASGWRWTAMIETLLNMIVARLALRKVELLHLKITDNYMGDDALIVLQEQPTVTSKLVRILHFYKSYGLKTHPTKQQVSTVRIEYFGDLHFSETMQGYVSRKVDSVIQRYYVGMSSWLDPRSINARIIMWMFIVASSKIVGLNRDRSIHRSSKMKCKPPLTPDHKKSSLEFARENMSMNWKQVCFSDEKRWAR